MSFWRILNVFESGRVFIYELYDTFLLETAYVLVVLEKEKMRKYYYNRMKEIN